MSGIRTILAAIDLSEYSIEIMKVAMEIAYACEAELIFLNVISQRDIEAMESAAGQINSPSIEEIFYQSEEDRKKRLNHLLDQFGVAHSDLEYRTMILRGEPYIRLLDTIKNFKVDLVVMGAKGRTDLVDVPFGSTGEKVFRHSPVPVLSVRHRREARLA